MLIVPLQAVPSQTVNAQLGGQSCAIAVYQLSTGLFMDLASNGAAVVSGVLCQNLNRIVREAYRGFAGDFSFVDTQGQADPDFTGLGGRYALAYLEPADLAARTGL